MQARVDVSDEGTEVIIHVNASLLQFSDAGFLPRPFQTLRLNFIFLYKECRLNRLREAKAGMLRAGALS